MKPRHVAEPAQLRAHAADVATMMTAASAAAAQVGQVGIAFVCQWTADVHRVVSALWSRAAVSHDPYTDFFTTADRVLTAADPAGLDPDAGPWDALMALRAAMTSACLRLNIPLVFPQASHVVGLPGPVDLERVRDALLGGSDPRSWVADRLAEAAVASGAQQTRARVDAYLVDAARRTGDDLMVTAAARHAVMNQVAPAGVADQGMVEAAARRVLGPVEWVRATPYLAGEAVAS